MDEASRGKQRTQPLKPSRLREAHQAPRSDEALPDTQLDTDDIPPAEDDVKDEDIDADDLAFLKRNEAKSLGDDAKPSSSFPQTFGISKPTSAAGPSSQTCFGFARPTTRKASSKPDTLASEHNINADTAILSIENSINGETKQATRSMEEASLPDPLSRAVTEIDNGNPTAVEGLQNTSHPVSVMEKEEHGNLSADSITKDASDTEVVSKPLLQAAATVKKRATAAKAKKGRKILLSRPLVPWPPRQDSAPNASKASPVGGRIEDREEKICSTHSGEAFAVRTQSEGALTPVDGLCDSEQPLPTSQALTVGVAAAEPFEPNVLQCKDNHRRTQLPKPQHQASADRVHVQPKPIASLPALSEHPLTCAAQQGHGRFSQTKHARSLSLKAKGALSVPTESPMPPELLEQSDDLQNARVPRREQFTGRPSPELRTAEPNPILGDRPKPTSVREPLHTLSDQSRPVRVTKTPSRAKHAHRTQRTKTTVGENSQLSQNLTVLNSALDVFRNACVADQLRAESQITATIKTLEEEKQQLQSLISQQEKEIADLKVAAKGVHERLEMNVLSCVKFVSGLQRDHDNSGKKFTDLNEQVKQLHQPIEVIRGNRGFENALLTKLASLAKLQRDTLAVAKSAQMEHMAALKREKALRNLMDHQANMHDEGESRRIELEEQLLPSVKSMQRKLDESFDALSAKVDSFQTILEGQDDARCCIKECLLILKRLDSLPLLTAKHVQKAEDMLRFLHERGNANFDLLAKSSDNQPFPIDDIQHFLRDHIQGLQSKKLQHDQTLADGERSQKTVQSLSLELDVHRQDKQQLEGPVNELRQTEATLDSRIVQLEQSNQELRSSLRDYENSARESEVNSTVFREQLSQAQDDLRESSDKLRQQVRLRVEQAREFASYRVHTLVRLKDLDARVVQMSDHAQAQGRESNKLEQEAANLKTTLKSAEDKIKELTTDVHEHKSELEPLRQGHHDALEKEGHARSLLTSTQETNRRLEQEREKHLLELDENRTQLRESDNAKANLLDQQLSLQQQLTKSNNDAQRHKAQLQQAKIDFEARLQQTQAHHAEETARLQSSLTLSENARKESEAKLRQTEAAHKQQIDAHEQKVRAKFQELASEADQVRKGLEAEHQRKMEQCRKNAECGFADTTKETQISSKAADCGSAEILVPNTQQSIKRGEYELPEQPSQKGKSRKRVDRHAESATNLELPDTLRVEVDVHGRTDVIEGSDSPQIRVETDMRLAEYFEEEYETRFGSRTQSRGYKNQQSFTDPDAEIVPETQDFECAQAGAAPFETIESQPHGDGDVDQEEAGTELSNMASEDLSEMLLDLSPGCRRRQSNSTPHRVVQTSSQSAGDPPSDNSPMNSQSRPKSRANTASRMMPLPGQGLQQRQGHVMPEHSERSVDTHSEGSSEILHADGTDARRTHAQHASARMVTSDSHIDLSRKRRTTGEVDVDGSFKKLRTSIQSYTQRASSTSRSHTPYTSVSPGAGRRTDVEASPPSATARRSSVRRSVVSGSQTGISRLSSARNTRSKANQYADRFGQELDRQ